MFGKVESETQDESTRFNPQSPYAVAKTFAYYMTRYYRQVYGMHASNVILFNHESPRRPADYVTRKISQSVARIFVGKQSELILGDTSAKIDWGFSGDYVEAEWLALQQDKADDYVIATGEAHSVQDFVDAAFATVGLDPKDYVKSSQEFYRVTPTSTLVGNSAKAREVLGFHPKVSFSNLVRMMVENDLEMEKN
jgi:GDPmannose 4,6-dehydratase